MQTIQLDIKDDKFDMFLSMIKNLKNDIVEDIRIKDQILDIKPLNENSSDYNDIKNTKLENNKKYNIQDAKRILKI
jgi:hypothetical protein